MNTQSPNLCTKANSKRGGCSIRDLVSWTVCHGSQALVIYYCRAISNPANVLQTEIFIFSIMGAMIGRSYSLLHFWTTNRNFLDLTFSLLLLSSLASIDERWQADLPSNTHTYVVPPHLSWAPSRKVLYSIMLPFSSSMTRKMMSSRNAAVWKGMSHHVTRRIFPMQCSNA